MIITPQQSRMARAALDLTVRELARQAGVAPSAISRFESGQTLPSDRLLRLRGALEEGGVTFLPEEAAEGPGVRLAKGFERSVIVDGEGKHVAGIVGPLVREVVGERAIATVQDGLLYSFSGDPLGALRPADMFNGIGSLPESALERLKDDVAPSAEVALHPAADLVLDEDQDRSDNPA